MGKSFSDGDGRLAGKEFVNGAEPEHKFRAGAIAILFRPPFRLADVVRVDFRTRQVLVIRRSATVAAPGALCFPGGGIEPGESPSDAVVREFLEEVGVAIRVGEVVAQNQTPVGAPLYWFVAELADPTETEPEFHLQTSEVAGYEWRTLAELLEEPDFLPNNLAVTRDVVDGRISLR